MLLIYNTNVNVLDGAFTKLFLNYNTYPISADWRDIGYFYTCIYHKTGPELTKLI